MRNGSSTTRTLLLMAALTAGAGVAHADITFNNFNDLDGLSLVGNARQSGSMLTVSGAEDFSTGAVWFTDEKQSVTGFDTTFVFGTTERTTLGADGLAFVIQNERADAIGGSGGAIGYGSNVWFDQTGISNSLAVEIDMWDNKRDGDWQDLNDSHVSVQTNGTGFNQPDSAFSLGEASTTVDLDNSIPHVVRITYAENTMRVFIDDMLTPQLTVSDLDISSLLDLDNDTAWVGFTSASAGEEFSQANHVFSWEYTETIPLPAPAGVGLLALGGLAAARRRR